MGELLKQLEDHLERLDPVSFVVANDFIEGWKAPISDWQLIGFSQGHV